MLRTHRDFKRKNKANLAVQGTVYAKINKESINLLQLTINTASPNELSDDLKNKLSNLIKIASDSSNCMLNKMLLAQSDINTHTCHNYGKKQFTCMKNSCSLKENINLVTGVSNYVMTASMVNMVKDIVSCGDSQSGKIDITILFIILRIKLQSIHLTESLYSCDFNTLKVFPTILSNNVSESVADSAIYSTVHEYITTSLSSRSDDSYYSPYAIGNLLARHTNIPTDHGILSKSKIINHLVKHKMVPLKKTSLYKLSEKSKCGLVHQDATWTEVTVDGRNGYLSSRELNDLILEIKNKTTGGVALSTSEVRREIKNKIISLFQKRRKSHLLPATIPQHTLNVYVSIIKAQNVFNIYGNVSNKTQSRSVAEWSLRSTIAYTMIVAVNHFLPNVPKMQFHPKRRDLSARSVELWNAVEEAYNKMLGTSEKDKIEMQPVLPNLVTTTDEVTLFATSSTVNSQENLYIVAKPEELKNEVVSSNSRNHYKQQTSGDSHCRGVRIVINSTFTAGGLSAPIFVAVYGLSNEEMPGTEIMTIEVPGLTVGSHQDVYSNGVGYLTFVKGSGEYNSNNEVEVSNSNLNRNNENTISANDTQRTFSKESRIAQLYREKVFYPFISHIRKTKYGYDGDLQSIPDYLQCVSWMDGCNSQLKLITSEENMEKEKMRKIVCCKHSAARTAVEQAADTGAMFKHLKRIVRSTENPTSANNSIYHHLQQTFTNLSNDPTSSDFLHLLSHKKKAVILTLAKLPIATARAYSDHVIKKAFMINGQLDLDHQLVPCLESCLNTYRGNISGTCLEQRSTLIESLYENTYTQGIVDEGVFDNMGIPKDVDCRGDIINRDFSITNESRQRSKCLTSDTQVKERRAIVLESKMVIYRRKLALFEAEEKEYGNNKVCEMKLVTLFEEVQRKEIENNDEDTNTSASTLPTSRECSTNTFNCMCNRLTYHMVKGYKGKVTILKCDMKAFIRVRSERLVRNGKITYLNVPDLKDDLLVKLVHIRNIAITSKVHEVPPALPI